MLYIRAGLGHSVKQCGDGNVDLTAALAVVPGESGQYELLVCIVLCYMRGFEVLFEYLLVINIRISLQLIECAQFCKSSTWISLLCGVLDLESELL